MDQTSLESNLIKPSLFVPKFFKQALSKNEVLKHTLGVEMMPTVLLDY